jgi:uncharacterized membrane protein YsdA (DUF1294 family)
LNWFIPSARHCLLWYCLSENILDVNAFFGGWVGKRTNRHKITVWSWFVCS